MTRCHVVRFSWRRSNPLPMVSVLVLTGLAAAGCAKDDAVVVPGTPPPTLSEIWPNQDGRTWTYGLVLREWDPPPPVVYASGDLVPPVTFSTVAAVLASRPTGSNPTADTVSVLLRFNGVATFPSGVEVQLLQESNVAPGFRSGSGTPWVARRRTTSGGLESRLARPHGVILIGAQFVHGGYWRRTPQWVGTHTFDATDTLPNWKFLEADLTPGHTFEVALIPDLAPEVKLHGRVVRSLTVQTPAGAVSNGIEVHYFIDYGVTGVTDDEGTLMGYARQFTCASVLYAPGVGPVRSDERAMLFAGSSTHLGAGDRLLDLISTSTTAASIAAR